MGKKTAGRKHSESETRLQTGPANSIPKCEGKDNGGKEPRHVPKTCFTQCHEIAPQHLRAEVRARTRGSLQLSLEKAIHAVAQASQVVLEVVPLCGFAASAQAKHDGTKTRPFLKTYCMGLGLLDFWAENTSFKALGI